MGHGARGDEDEEGAEGKGEGAVAARKLQDSIGRGKQRGREVQVNVSAAILLNLPPDFVQDNYVQQSKINHRHHQSTDFCLSNHAGKRQQD